MSESSLRIKELYECIEFIRSHQWAVECNQQMEDVLATIARSLELIAKELG